MRPLIAAAVVLFLCARPLPAGAVGDGPAFDPTEGFLPTFFVAELLFPDARAEMPLADGTDPEWTLSWPVALNLGHASIGKPLVVRVHPFAELQYSMGADAFRALLGTRLLFGAHGEGGDLSKHALALEGAGVAGSDGRGVMIGGGPVVHYGRGINLGLILRGTRTPDGWRGDIAVDLQFPL